MSPPSKRKSGPSVSQHLHNSIDENEKPAFDFSRSYAFSKIVCRDHQCATLLNVEVKKHITKKPFVQLPPSPNAFTISHAGAHKGLGMFARRDLPMGTLILSEHPVVLTALATGPAELYSVLDESTLQAIASLANSFPAAGCTFEGIMQTNAINVELDSRNPQHHALFLNASRCNHSCRPNAAWKWNVRSFSLSLIAVRSIHAGEEITVTYVDPTNNRETRRRELHASYNFDCHCPACDCTPAEAMRSDTNRRELAKFWQRQPLFETWLGDADIAADYLIVAHQHALELRQKEGLQLLEYRKHVDEIVMCHAALAEAKMFRYWLKRARACRGEADADHIILLDIWYEQPSKFPVWGWRCRC